MRQRAGLWRFDEGVRASGEAGSLRHYRAVATASVRQGNFSIGGRYQHDEVGEAGPAHQGIEVGGAPSSIVPDSAMSSRIFDPALPAVFLTGKRYDGTRFEATTPMLPVTLFYQVHRTDLARSALAGIEARLNSAPIPLLRIPGMDVTAGVARTLDEPRHRTRAWLAMRWRP
jgi:hypothetical protein